MKPAVSLVLADDHAMFRAGLKRLLEEQHYAVVAEAATGREAVAAVMQTKPEILVIDFSMPDLNGLEAAARVLRTLPQTKVILLSMHRHESYVLQALQYGSLAYVVKDSAFRDLLEALAVARQGRKYVSPSALTPTVQQCLRHREPVAAATPLDALTPREREFFQLIAEGKSTKGIASDLGISVKTAETHRAHLMRKLHVHSVAELIHAAVQWGVLHL